MNSKALGTWHRALGGISRGNGRFRVEAACKSVAVVTLAAVMSAGLGGCELLGGWGEPKVNFNGKPSTAAEIRAETDAAAREAERKAKDQADTMAANLRAEADAAKIEQARRKAALDAAVAGIDADTRSKLAALQAEYETASLETTLRIDRMAADTQRAVATLGANAAAKIDAAKASADTALAKIAEIAERREGLLNVAVTGANAVPVWGGLIAAAITGIGGVAWGRKGTVPVATAKKSEDDAWKEATEAAHAARDKADTHYDLGKNESMVNALLAAVLGGAVPGIKLPTTTPPAAPGDPAKA